MPESYHIGYTRSSRSFWISENRGKREAGGVGDSGGNLDRWDRVPVQHFAEVYAVDSGSICDPLNRAAIGTDGREVATEVLGLCMCDVLHVVIVPNGVR